MDPKFEHAFAEFSDGIVPDNYKAPKTWYVIGPDGSHFPAKAIWALANKVDLPSFNTREALKGLTGAGYRIVEGPNLPIDGLDAAISEARSLSREERLNILSLSPKKPMKTTAIITTYARSHIVIAEVLERAQGKCEACLLEAPFKKAKDGTPYLEVHHKVRLADDGDDTVENAIAVCPNCHRKAHHG